MCAAAQCDMAFASACHPRRAAACFLTAAGEDAPSYQPDRTTSVSCFVCCAFIAWPTTPGTMVLGAVCTIPNRIQQYRPRSDRLSAPTFVECTPNWVCNRQKVGNAVVRNRIRRRLRPIIVAEAHHLPPGIYLIGVKNDQAARISHDELDDDLRTTLAAASRAPR